MEGEVGGRGEGWDRGRGGVDEVECHGGLGG